MKILIPTAKELNTNQPDIQPISLSEKTRAVIQELSHYSIEELAKLYQVRLEMAEKEYERIRLFKMIRQGITQLSTFLMVLCIEILKGKS